ncbi:hypothetical protein EBU02_13100 [bacterium]|nr:hypothetical protein [bacterium]
MVEAIANAKAADFTELNLDICIPLSIEKSKGENGYQLVLGMVCLFDGLTNLDFHFRRVLFSARH